jgi:hypothetical protein
VAQLINDTKSPLHLRDSSTNTFQAISQISTTEAYKYVGTQLAVDGNMKAQIEDLEERCSLMGSIFSQHYLMHKMQILVTLQFIPHLSDTHFQSHPSLLMIYGKYRDRQ